QTLLPSDWELFDEILEGAIRRVPVLAKAELAHLVNGPEGITPDSRPLLGPLPGVPGFWMAAGLSHTGFGAGGAIGAILADWLVDGEPPYDVTELNVRRFGSVYADRAYAAERARESYRYYYMLRYPHDENEWARGRRPSPLADNDVDRPPGSVVYTQFLNPRGGIESDLTITRWAEDRFRVTTGSNFLASDLGWIRMHMPSRGVEARDVTDQLACIGLWGPAARRVLARVTTSDVSNEALPYMSARWIDLAGVRVQAQRVTYVGELGWELYVPNEHAVAVWDALLGAGRPLGVEPAGYKAVDSLRLEKGYRYWSSDLTPAENP